MDRISLSASEWRVMEALWTGPKTLMELVRELGDSAGWAKSTVATMVRRMEAKGLIEGRPEGRRKVFHPLLRRQDAAASETDSLLERAYHGSVGLLVSGLVERNRRLRPGGAVRHSAQGGGGNMKEILVSSSLLILLLAALRPLLRGRIRPQAAYALWPLVALRLLVPVSPVRSALSAGALLGEPPVLEALGETAVPVRSYEQAYRQVEAEYRLRGADPGALRDRIGREARALTEEVSLADLAARWARPLWLGGAAGWARGSWR